MLPRASGRYIQSALEFLPAGFTPLDMPISSPKTVICIIVIIVIAVVAITRRWPVSRIATIHAVFMATILVAVINHVHSAQPQQWIKASVHSATPSSKHALVGIADNNPVLKTKEDVFNILLDHPGPVRVHVSTCQYTRFRDFVETLQAGFPETAFTMVPFHAEWDVLLQGSFVCDTGPYDCLPCCTEIKKKNQNHAIMHQYTHRHSYRQGGIGNLWEAMGAKKGLCKLSWSHFINYGVHVTPPCFILDTQKDVLEVLKLASQWPFWILKTEGTSGKGNSLVSITDLLYMSKQDMRPKGALQGYVHDPILYAGRNDQGDLVKVKTDVRIYGLVSSIDPLRLYLSPKGYFRTGHPHFNYSMDAKLPHKVHMTNNGPIIKEGLWRNAADNATLSSAGSLHKYWTQVLTQYGLDPMLVWEEIHKLFVQLLIGSQEMIPPSKCTSGTCNRHMFTFFADVIIDQKGHAYLMEIHPSCVLKPQPLQRKHIKEHPSMAMGYDPMMTQVVREASWSVYMVGLARLLKPALLRHATKHMQMLQISSNFSNEDAQSLVLMVHEQVIASILNVEATLATRWKTYSNMLSIDSNRVYQLYQDLQLHVLVTSMKSLVEPLGSNAWPPPLKPNANETSWKSQADALTCPKVD